MHAQQATKVAQQENSQLSDLLKQAVQQLGLAITPSRSQAGTPEGAWASRMGETIHHVQPAGVAYTSSISQSSPAKLRPPRPVICTLPALPTTISEAHENTSPFLSLV